ncbi:hypothetical protein [uncultured Amphritea sp.]|uniref:hypothetical protein n=1 Tax=uncultured Amphritea sp. TaxID=981605 RepID=UPI00341E2D7E
MLIDTLTSANAKHPYGIIKCPLGFVKARYRGLMKNDSNLAMLLTRSDAESVRQSGGLNSAITPAVLN